MRKPRPIPKNERRPNFIRQWRKYRDDMTQASLVDRLAALGVELSDGQLSRIETGKQEYRQDQLEAIAAVLRCEPADLIVRDPTDPEGLWTIYDQLKPPERRRAMAVLKALKDDITGT